MQVRTIHHVGLEVDDLAEALEFYSEVLGLAVRTDRPDGLPPGAWIDVGDNRLAIGPRGLADHGPHVALVVDDLPAAVEHLRAHGVEVHELTKPYLNVIFCDRWGNWIELRQPPDVWERAFA